MIVEVDQHLDPRQMRRQRSSVPAAPCGSARSLGSIGCIGRGITARLDLLDLLQAEQQLVLRQRLGPAAEAMTLQLLDDLLEPRGARPFGQQHRLERAGIVRKRVGRRRHDAITPCVAASRERDMHTDSLCRSSTRLDRRRCLARGVDALPV
ncbi:hypothetical protein ACVWXN_006645 [Bradyrhizobium sp. i1.4.4]